MFTEKKAKDARNIDSFRRCGYEVWKPKWFKNSDGTVVWAKPCDEDFGTYGWYCMNEAAKDIRIQKILQTDKNK